MHLGAFQGTPRVVSHYVKFLNLGTSLIILFGCFSRSIIKYETIFSNQSILYKNVAKFVLVDQCVHFKKIAQF